MAAGRSLKALVSRRRRVGDEGEDEEGPVIVNDSQSEGSVLSEGDDDDDLSSFGVPNAADDGHAVESGNGKVEEGGTNGSQAVKKARKAKKKSKKGKESATEFSQTRPSLKAMADTEAMMNGLNIGDAPAVDFESLDPNAATAPAVQATSSGPPTGPAPPSNAETPAQRQRREHEEYRRKRDADPAFIPNRGNFFMHDTRGPNGQPPPMRGAWQGRGRGRGGPAASGPFPAQAHQMTPAERPAEQTWKHDLHDTINEEPQQTFAKVNTDNAQVREPDDSGRLFPKPAPPNQVQPRMISFSSTTLVGKVQIRVLLPGFKAPITFSEVPWKHYVRLPNHRPPLRRDKPVRVSLPDRSPQYIFPSPERSFIFIPREMRPNQRGYQRGSFQRSVGGYGYSSRRTSVYGGSVYASSMGASRRSSLAGISRADAFSPNSFGSGFPPPTRPVVRLPHGAQQALQPFSGGTTPSGPMSGYHTPIGMPPIQNYPLPQQPTYQGTPTSTVHQPRPQKAISVTGIESPALLQQATSTEPQPFQNQLPAHMVEQPAYAQPPPPQYFSPRQQYAYPAQPQSGTPLSGIPEQAMQAQPYQPPGMPYGQAPYYPPYPAQQQFYYPPQGPNGYAPMPMYAPPQGFMAPPPPQMPPQQAPPPQAPPQPSGDEQQQGASQPQSGMVAHESNGMVFYIPASEAQQQNETQNYQPAESFVPSYAMPGLPPPTPAPDTSAYYYPPMPQMNMPPMGYYPPQGP